MKDSPLKVAGKVSHYKSDRVNVCSKVIVERFLLSHSRHFMYPVWAENKSDQHILHKNVIFISRAFTHRCVYVN